MFFFTFQYFHFSRLFFIFFSNIYDSEMTKGDAYLDNTEIKVVQIMNSPGERQSTTPCEIRDVHHLCPRETQTYFLSIISPEIGNSILFGKL